MKDSRMARADEHQTQLRRRMRIMLICVGILFGGIFLYKFVMSLMIKYMMAHHSQTVTVSTMKADYALWQSELKAVGSLRAVRGVNVTSELAGMVKTIYFTPGILVNEGTLLVALNVDADIAQLQALQATAELSAITYKRDKAQFAIRGVSKEVVDTDAANLKNIQAQVQQQTATIAKKIIRAPFNGRLGISAVSPGQYINPGDNIVTLQQLDPIYVDFFVPQQSLVDLKLGQVVSLTSEMFPNKVFKGKITTINPLIDTTTRNVEIEATLSNPRFELVPGMFALVNVDTEKPERYITLPQTAISFNSYGSMVYFVKSDKNDAKRLIANQAFVTTGETRGDQVAILKGVQKGDELVTSGQLKLKNGTAVTINNAIVPADDPAPNLLDEH
jgi:membrane fusion protein (multidrug efflux system)